MIIDFTFENFRSFKDQTVFSMFTEHPKNHLTDNIGFPLKNSIGVAKTAVIYGPNASGKSNIFLALKALKYLVCESHSFRENKKIGCYEPFLFSDKKEDPVNMEIEFAIPGDHRYVYSISYGAKEILSESLDFYPGRAKANIFERRVGDTWSDIQFGSHYKGGNKRIPFFANNSYLSKAGNSPASPKIIRRVHKYFQELMILGTDFQLPVGEFFSHDGVLKLTSDILQRVDVGISDVTREEQDLSAFAVFPPDMPSRVKEELISLNKYKFFAHHIDENGESVPFELDEESDGTQKLFRMLPVITTSLFMGAVLMIDELENSFHPHVAELIIKLFNDPLINTKNAQLVFSTHNVELMSPRLFRRDQIWFTQKNSGSSVLYSLDEFDKTTVTPKSPYGDWYADGRFGAIPHIRYEEVRNFLVHSFDLDHGEVDSSGEEE
ncbi:AAA family ATPase [Pseudomonas sp. LH21]|uniref:AAA family ATPase n=1 Tax=Pseudomonas sp. LH21 TaxID=3114884 RepID=UPI002F91D1CD